MDLEFARPAAALIIPVAAILLALAVWRQRTRVAAWARFAEPALWRRLAPAASAWRPLLRAALLTAAIMSTTLALMDPRWGLRVEEIPRTGLDTFFLVDVSRSMLAEDATPNRLDRARQFVSDAIDRAAGDRVGLIEFAGAPAIRVPLTLNYGAFRTILAELSPQSAARGGTYLADAIELAIDSFPEGTGAPRALVILTDGEDMGEGDPALIAAKAAREHGIRIFTVGIGDSVDGARIPLSRGAQRTWLMHDGQEVWSRMDPELLARVAEAGEGLFVRAGTAQADFGEIYEQTVGQLERGAFEGGTIQRRTQRYVWFAGLALLLLVLESLVSDRRDGGWRRASARLEGAA
ncbi:MAG: VWA domain-containing protein [Phycisphaeraceae bacterium]|nr:VWA domain-containing protein [Phycisphaeraceae bacterium]